MKRAEVREKMVEFLGLLRQEQELRDQAAQLQFLGPERDVRDTIRDESELLKRVEWLRQEKMLPLLDELSGFVSTRLTALKTKKAAPRPLGAKPALGAKPTARPLHAAPPLQKR